jgi:hypothetical protein
MCLCSDTLTPEGEQSKSNIFVGSEMFSRELGRFCGLFWVEILCTLSVEICPLLKLGSGGGLVEICPFSIFLLTFYWVLAVEICPFSSFLSVLLGNTMSRFAPSLLFWTGHLV